MFKPAAAVLLAIWLAAGGTAAGATGSKPERVRVTGEVIDTWCYVTEIMFAEGTAHFQCAVWCAFGGIPVSLRSDDGEVFMLLKIGDDDTNVANPAVAVFQAHQVTVDGDLFRRDGVNYLLVTRIATDEGVVNITHDEMGIQPFGK
jgi:hypothetical protein